MNDRYTGEGYLRVRVFTADEIPLRGAVVYVSEDGGGVLYSLRTDRDGLTPAVSLPAPPAADALAENAAELPYARYHVDVRYPGYERVNGVGVPVFDSVTATQPIRMIPQSEFSVYGEEQTIEAPPDPLFGGGGR